MLSQDPGGTGETHPRVTSDRRLSLSASTRERSPLRSLRWFLLVILVAIAVGAFAGYRAGERQRALAQEQGLHEIIQEQFALGLVDLEEERYEHARQRFEYIIRLDPTFPQAPERLAEALLGLSEPIQLPTVVAPTPTPNLAPVEEIFTQAQAAYEAEDWSAVIEQLLALRAKDPDYRAVEVDGLMYAALSNRGIQRISQDQLLEEGIYDLSLAETFAPLDEDASNWRSWAQLYLTANSYYGLNWEQAAFYFNVVFTVAPGIRHDVYWKYAHALQMYADQLVAAGDPCAAEEQLDISLEVQFNEDLVPTATKVAKACKTATAPPPAPPEPSETPISEIPPTETGEPVETPTPEG